MLLLNMAQQVSGNDSETKKKERLYCAVFKSEEHLETQMPTELKPKTVSARLGNGSTFSSSSSDAGNNL